MLYFIFSRTMEYTKVAYLLAEPHNERWYFSVSSTKEQNTVCKVKFYTFVPIRGILTPESKPFGSLPISIQEFAHSASRQAEASIEENTKRLNGEILALEKGITALNELGETEAKIILCHVLDEKACERDELSELGPQYYLKSRKEVEEETPGVYGILKDFALEDRD